MTLVERPNPGYTAPGLDGVAVPGSLPMWRVQTRGDIDDHGLEDRIFGLVSRPQGFEDSPDAEVISGGVNTKSVDGVALARHGSYFHWGFSASPTHMTEEARTVFLNAVHYIAKFEGAPVLARKQDGVTLRASLPNELAALGEHIRERRLANASGILPLPPHFNRLARYLPAKHWALVADDAEAVHSELSNLAPYLYPTGYRTMGVDWTLQELGLANDSQAFLDTMELWLSFAKWQSTAMQILARYTDQPWITPKEWAAWLHRNRGQLFFSESAGYRWLSAAGEAPPSRSFLRPSDRAPLVWEARVETDAVGELLVALEVALKDGWHVHAEVPEHLPYQPLALELELPDHLAQVGEWHRPPPQRDPQHPGHWTWAGNLRFVARLEQVSAAEPGATIGGSIAYQACDAESCLPPAREVLRIALEPGPNAVPAGH